MVNEKYENKLENFFLSQETHARNIKSDERILKAFEFTIVVVIMTRRKFISIITDFD